MKKLLGISLPTYTKKDILDKIKKYTLARSQFIHITSLNPENMVIAQKDKLFKEIVVKSQIKIIDGVGIVLAAQTLNIEAANRIPGVDLVSDLITLSSVERLRVVLIGGEDKLAEDLANCYNRSYPQAKYIGLRGIENIKNIKRAEEEHIFNIITYTKPHLLLVAFGSPYQEKWIWKNKAKFKGIVCMGVGGSFDYLSGKILRPSPIIQKHGLEWLYRLIIQPWRLKRQLKLLIFAWYIFKEKLNY